MVVVVGDSVTVLVGDTGGGGSMQQQRHRCEGQSVAAAARFNVVQVAESCRTAVVKSENLRIG
jgi:hypothetical protein